MLNKMNEFVDHLNNVMEKPDNYSYDFSTRGSKYFKVHMNSHGSRSVYCFVDKRSGDIYKAAGWRGPAKGSRGSILDTNSYINSDWSGGWLYKVFGNVYSIG
jgi:hypothetical protein|tara:strand:- start:494 stop:799 length:306 start_codon:yes stop_codon:yes gene_type:complete